MFVFESAHVPRVHKRIKMNLRLFQKVKRRMLKRLGIPPEDHNQKNDGKEAGG